MFSLECRDNYTGQTSSGSSIGTVMVRLPLSAAELDRGRRLGAVLRETRGARTMLDIAHAAGISPETLRKIESGRIATPSFQTVAAIADAVGISLDQLWAEVEASTLA